MFDLLIKKNFEVIKEFDFIDNVKIYIKNIDKEINMRNADIYNVLNIEDIYIFYFSLKYNNIYMGTICFFVKEDFLNKDNFSTMILIKEQIELICYMNVEKESETKKNTFDYLTGLYNKEIMLKIISNGINENKNNVLLMIDIDNFKSINDNLGHIFGDFVLKKVADNIKQSLRQKDYVGRYGGEEFVVFLPKIKLEDAVCLSERILTNIESMVLKQEDNSCVVTVSIGIAVSDLSDTPLELIDKADKALYESKRTGKNKYTVFQDRRKKL